MSGSEQIDKDWAIRAEAAIARMASAQRGLDRNEGEAEDDESFARSGWGDAFETALIGEVESIHTLFRSDPEAIRLLLAQSDPQDTALAIRFLAHVTTHGLKIIALLNPELDEKIAENVERERIEIERERNQETTKC